MSFSFPSLIRTWIFEPFVNLPIVTYFTCFYRQISEWLTREWTNWHLWSQEQTVLIFENLSYISRQLYLSQLSAATSGVVSTNRNGSRSKVAVNGRISKCKLGLRQKMSRQRFYAANFDPLMVIGKTKIKNIKKNGEKWSCLQNL